MKKVFYDIILATEDLGFRQKARIYWVLNDVKKLAESTNKKCKVIIIIGNLEKTHFFQGLSKDEISDSIKDLEKVFEPACKNGLLEIRTHLFTQDDIEILIKESA